jgi:Fe2+ transport system protein FeoA
VRSENTINHEKDRGYRRFMFTSDNGKITTRNMPGPEPALTLGRAKVGKVYMLIGFDGGHHLREKIYSMGLNSGAHFRVISNPGFGPVSLEVRQTRLGIGRGMAAEIRIKEVEP